MQNVSDSFRAAIDARRPQRIYMRFHDQSGGEITLSNADIYANDGLTITEILNSDDDLTVGKAPMSSLDVSIMNENGMYAGMDFSKRVDVRLGVKTETQSFKPSNTPRMGVRISDAGYVYVSNSSVLYYQSGENAISYENPGPIDALVFDGVYLYIVSGSEISQRYGPVQSSTLGAVSTVTLTDVQSAQIRRIAEKNRCISVDGNTMYECTISGDSLLCDKYETVPLGTYYGEKPEKVKVNIIKFKAYDSMSRMEKVMDDYLASLRYPTTLGEIWSSVASRFLPGVSIDASAFPNREKPFASEPMHTQNMTARDVLAMAAETAGSYSMFDHGGALKMLWFGEASRTEDHMIPKTKRFSLSVAEYEVPKITGIKVHVSEQDIGVDAGTDTNVYEILDNPYLYGASEGDIKPYAQVILNRLASFPVYRPLSVRCEYNGVTEVGDMMTVEDDDGTMIDFPVFMQTITWSGIAKVTYECTGNSSRKGLTMSQKQKLSAGHASHEWELSLERVYSRIESAEGTVSEVQQTAKEISSQVSDLAGNLSSISQTADKINWLVQSGSSESNFTMTPRALQLIAASIELTGYVTFNDLENAGSTKINGANITTGMISADRIDVSKLRVTTVYFNSDQYERAILSSNVDALGSLIDVGIQEAPTGLGNYMFFHGNAFSFQRSGYGHSDDNAFAISAENRKVILYTDDKWEIGSSTARLGAIYSSMYYFDETSYLRLRNGRLYFYSSGSGTPLT